MNEKIFVTAKKSETKGRNTASLGRKRGLFQSVNSPINHIFSLQRTIGNQAVMRLIDSGVIQARLKINQPGDKYEKEADHIAEQVMSMPEPQQTEAGNQVTRNCNQKSSGNSECPSDRNDESFIQGKIISEQITPLIQRQDVTGANEEEEEKKKEEENEGIQGKQVSSCTPEPPSDISSRIRSLKGSGQPLPTSVRTFFEPRFGYNFNQVEVYNNEKAADVARSINAKAFTAGKDVVFGAGEYSPETVAGKRLLAHELTHVVQQNSD